MPPEEKKLDKLSKLFEIVNEDYATTEDLVKVTETILSIITSERQKLEANIAENKGIIDKATSTTLQKLADTSGRLKELIFKLSETTSKKIDNVESKFTTQLSKEIKRVEKKIPQKTDLTEIRAEIKDIENKLPNIATEITKNGEAVRDSLELLKDEERLDKSAIKGLDDYDELIALARTPKEVVGAGVRFLRYLADVNIEGITNGQTIVWNATTGKFEPGSGGIGGGHTIEDEGTPLTQRTNLNFVGAGVTVTDDAGNDATVVTIPGGGSGGGDVTKVGTPVNNQVGVWTGDGTLEGDANLTFDTTTDTLTTVNVSATNVTAGASTFTALNVNGAGGNGHIHLKHQTSDPASQASSSTIFADSNGNIGWINDGLSKITLDGDGVSAARTYTLPDASGTVALTSDLHSAVTVTDSTSIDFTLTGQDITAQREALTGAITAPKNSNTTSLGSFTTAQLNTALSDNDVATGGGTATGTNTGDQTITLTSDVTGSGTGSFATTIANNAVSLAKMADIATDSIIGRATAGTGDPEVLTALPFAFTGDVTRPADSNAQTIANSAVTLAKMADVATSTVFYRKTAGTGVPEVQTLATLKTDLGLTGTNSGDQTSIVGITGTKAQFDTAVTDGNFLYVGDVTQYTDEQAQDAVGAMVATSIVYNDAGATLQRAALTGAITASQDSNTTALGSFTISQLNTAVSDANIIPEAGGTFTGDISVPDEVYGVGWNGSLEVPTKNALYDKIETLGGGGNTFNDIYIDQSGGTSDTYGVLTGTINGSNATFTVSQSAYATGTLKVYLNGQLMTQGSSEDFVETTPASGTFTFNTAPASGSLITVEYQKVVVNSSTIATKDDVYALYAHVGGFN